MERRFISMNMKTLFLAFIAKEEHRDGAGAGVSGDDGAYVENADFPDVWKAGKNRVSRFFCVL